MSNMRITICHKIFFTLFCITMTVFSFSDVYAQSSWKHLSLKGLVDFIIQGVAGVLIPLAVTVLIFVFIYGIAVYMRAAGQGDGKMADLAKTRLLYGIVVLFAVFSLWGFVQILRNLFGGNEVFRQAGVSDEPGADEVVPVPDAMCSEVITDEFSQVYGLDPLGIRQGSRTRCLSPEECHLPSKGGCSSIGCYDHGTGQAYIEGSWYVRGSPPHCTPELYT